MTYVIVMHNTHHVSHVSRGYVNIMKLKVLHALRDADSPYAYCISAYLRRMRESVSPPPGRNYSNTLS